MPASCNIFIIALSLSSFSCTTLVKRSLNQDYTQGRQSLSKSNSSLETSRQKIIQSNSLRRELSQLHAKNRRIKTKSANKENLQSRIRKQNSLMKKLRKEGAQLRTTGTLQHEESIEFFTKALQHSMKQWIHHSGPIQLDTQDYESMSHNPKVGSVDPKVLSLQAAMEDSKKKESGTGFLAIRNKILKEQNAPPSLNLGSFQISKDHKLFAHIEIKHSPTQKRLGAPLNEVHEWRLIVVDLWGQPVSGDIKIVGHMPGHVHGLPTQPEVTREDAPGVYTVEGMKFQMRGWWVLEFILGDDRVKFNVAL